MQNKGTSLMNMIAASHPTHRGIDRGMYRSGNETYSQPRYNLRLMLLAVVYLIVEMILRRIATVHGGEQHKSRCQPMIGQSFSGHFRRSYSMLRYMF